MAFRKILFALIVLFTMGLTTVWAGDIDRIGTTGGTQVQVPVGGRAFAMNGADLVNTSGLDALFWNPAGLKYMSGNTEGMFSFMNYVADISLNYFAVGFNAGSLGHIGVSVKSFSFGDIPVTTVIDMDGESGQTYSPNMSIVGLTYAKGLSDKISFGMTGKVINESIPRAAASAFAMDLGIQYHELLDIKNLGLGVVVKNIGSSLNYSGAGLLLTAEDSDENFSDYRSIEATTDQLPSTFELGLSYNMDLSFGKLLLASSFQSNHSENDYIRLGGELNVSDMFFVRAGQALMMTDADNPDAGSTLYGGFTAGAGLKLDLGGSKIIIDYTYRPVEYSGFSDNQIFALGFEF